MRALELNPERERLYYRNFRRVIFPTVSLQDILPGHRRARRGLSRASCKAGSRRANGRRLKWQSLGLLHERCTTLRDDGVGYGDYLETFFGHEIVANRRRLCLMNMFLHDIGGAGEMRKTISTLGWPAARRRSPVPAPWRVDETHGCHPERSSVRAKVGRNAVEGPRRSNPAQHVNEPPGSFDCAAPALPPPLRSG